MRDPRFVEKQPDMHAWHEPTACMMILRQLDQGLLTTQQPLAGRCKTNRTPQLYASYEYDLGSQLQLLASLLHIYAAHVWLRPAAGRLPGSATTCRRCCWRFYVSVGGAPTLLNSTAV
jgi:hypothetical protein